MNEVFYELPKKTQRAIYNAAMEVFGETSFARSDSAETGVSKGYFFIISIIKHLCIYMSLNMLLKLLESMFLMCICLRKSFFNLLPIQRRKIKY